MLYAWVHPEMVATPGGVLVKVDWYEVDPDEDRSAQPWLLDQLMLPVPDVASVNDVMLDTALNARRIEREAEHESVRRSSGAMQPGVAAMLGHGRAFRSGRSYRPSESRRSQPPAPPVRPKGAEVTRG